MREPSGGMSAGRSRLAGWIGGVFGLLVAASALPAIADPLAWYLTTPGVAGTGPFNAHFARDVAAAYLASGAAFALGAAWRAQRPGLWLAAAAWLVGHAAVHLGEAAAGLCTPADLAVAAPGVLLPALVAAVLAGAAASGRQIGPSGVSRSGG